MQVIPFLPDEPFLGLRLVGAVDVAWCEELAAELSRRGFAATGARYPRGYRDNDRLVIDDEALAARLCAALREGLPEQLEREGARWQLVGLNARLRACRYRDGQSFCIHRDGPYHPDEETRSWLTVQLYLDDASRMRGGLTRFYADAEGRAQTAAIEPARGDVIVFDHRVWHDGEPVTAGEKRVLRSDAVYRRVGAAERSAAPAGARLLGRHRGYAWRVVARRDGSTASSGRDGTVRLWREGGGAAHQVAASSVTALAEDRQGALWAGTRDGSIVRLGEGTPVRSGEGAILSLAVRASGTVLASTSLGELLELREGEPIRRQRVHQGWAWGLAAAGDLYATAGDDGELAFSDGRRVSLGQPLRAVAALARGAWLAGTREGLIYLLTGNLGGHLGGNLGGNLGGSRRELIRGHTGAITALATAADGAHWASASEDGSVKLWRSASGADRGAALVWEAPRREDFVTSVAFASSGELITAGYDGAIHRYQLPILASPPSHLHPPPSATSQLLAVVRPVRRIGAQLVDAEGGGSDLV